MSAGAYGTDFLKQVLNEVFHEFTVRCCPGTFVDEHLP